MYVFVDLGGSCKTSAFVDVFGVLNFLIKGACTTGEERKSGCLEKGGATCQPVAKTPKTVENPEEVFHC